MITPSWAKWAVLGVLVASIGALFWRVGVLKAESETLTTQRDAAIERARMSELAASAAQAERKKEQDYARRAILAADAAASAATAERVAAARAARAGNGLLDAARRAAATCGRAVPASASAASGNAPTPDAGVVLADVLGRLEYRARQLAQTAGERGTAGQACNAERAALTTP